VIIIGRFEGEKLAEDWVEYDRYNLFRQLGAAGEMLRRPSKEALARAYRSSHHVASICTDVCHRGLPAQRLATQLGN
jgi:hypothetical protein